MIRSFPLVCTTDSAGAGTVTGALPGGSGEILELRNNGTVFNASGTATYTLTRDAQSGFGTVVSATRVAPFSLYAGGSINGGGPSSFTSGIPVVGAVTLTLAGAGSVVAGTVTVLYRA